MHMILGKLWEFEMDREAWCAAIHGVWKNRIILSDWTELKKIIRTVVTVPRDQVIYFASAATKNEFVKN